MNSPLTITTLAFLCLGIGLPASDAVGQQKTLKELIVGTWLLDSVYDQAQDGRKNEPWGRARLILFFRAMIRNRRYD